MTSGLVSKGGGGWGGVGTAARRGGLFCSIVMLSQESLESVGIFLSNGWFYVVCLACSIPSFTLADRSRLSSFVERSLHWGKKFFLEPHDVSLMDELSNMIAWQALAGTLFLQLQEEQ